MSFYGVVCKSMKNNTNHVVYGGCNVGMLYIRSVYVVHQGTNTARSFVVRKAGFV